MVETPLGQEPRTAAAAASPYHTPRLLTEAERELWRQRSAASRLAKLGALRGEAVPLHELNVPKLDPYALMPQQDRRDGGTLSLFSGGGGLDLGFARAGFAHSASFEILTDASETLRRAGDAEAIHGGADGDVTGIDWRQWRGAEVVHGGPPCQPFSTAGRQRGRLDERDMWPAYVDCLLTVRPRAFIAENVPALASRKFAPYVEEHIVRPLSRRFHITRCVLRAQDFGVPQTRRRLFFIGFARERDFQRFQWPASTHEWPAAPGLLSVEPQPERCYGVREALGLPKTGYDALSPTIRSSLTGPRATTSILNSTAAQRAFAKLGIWPNGVAPTREEARAFPAPNGHFRLSVPDVALLQGFPDDWPFAGATYMRLGQIGNAVPPPLAYAVASSLAAALA